MNDLSSVDVFDLLERADVKRARAASGGREANFSCPFSGHSHGDESPSAYMNVETTAWFCQGCKRRGNAVSFWAEVQNVSTPEAQRFLRETYGIEFSEPIGGSMQSEIDMRFAPVMDLAPVARPSRAFLSSLRYDWAAASDDEFRLYMLDRGFSPAVMADWDVGYDYLSNRITLPVFDVDEELFGVKGRAWNDWHQPKYLVLGDASSSLSYGFPPYEAAEVVFGLHRARGYKTAVLCEGELNAIACSQAGVIRPVATGMSYLSARHIQLVVREVDEVVLFYDPDQAGHDAAYGRVAADGGHLPGAVELLEPFLPVRVVVDHEYDPAEYLRLGRGSEIIELAEGARSTLEVEKLLR